MVELANGAVAVVVAVDEHGVRIDANHVLAGKTLCFEVTVVGIEKFA